MIVLPADAGDPQVPRIALSPAEAAKSLGVSRSFFYESILPELPVARVGRRRLVRREELDEWLRARAKGWDD
jgi:excisionase family DNA binding protein